MKHWYLIPLACLAGFLVGEWGPRERIRALEEAGREPRAEAPGRKASGFDDFARIVNIPQVAKKPHVARAGKPGKAARSAAKTMPVKGAAAEVVATNAPATNVVAKKAEPPPKKLSPEDLRARIEEAQQLWGTRVELARATWREKLRLEGDSAQKFEAAIDEMNDKLLNTMTTLATLLSQNTPATPELGFKLIGDATTIMAETYEAVGAAVAPELRDTVSTMPITDFVDPGVVEPLVEVQDKLEGFRGLGGHGR